ncbi:hypothetical protein GCM10007874_14450 [Labrys miyagiensis]|uniref:Localization factor PodJL n=1 Tax=Labrys miyagiensis TaxID=346912 RepID=A0ABQ6CFH7_9HYPH|nr:hypothetical protein [Labrys miyagiensis]GLS18428.1 hypothetical protein GCM10007874_14450 [Labrys miyagiensis]
MLARHIRASEARMAGLVERLIRRQEESEAHIAALVDAVVDGFAGRQAEPEAAPQHRSDNAPDYGSVEDLERRLAEMSAGLEVAPAQPEVEPPPVDALSEQIAALTREIAELRRANMASAAGKGDVADLRADIAALGQHLTGMATPAHIAQIDRKLDLLARQAQDPTVLASIQRETADIRTRLGDLARQPDPSQRLEQKLDALQLAVEDGQAATSSSLSALSTRLEALDAPGHDDAALTALEQQIAAMGRSIEALGQVKPDLSGLEPALRTAFAQSALQTLPEELRRHYRELRGLQEGEVREGRKALDALQTLLHQVASRLAAVEDFVRARTIGTLVPGPPEIGDVPSLFSRERPDDIVWSQELPRSLAGDAPFDAVAKVPLDGRPSQVSVLARGGSVSTGNTRGAFIAAARRAARAAAEAEGSLAAEETAKPGGNHEPFYKRHKRPILLGLAAVTMMMGALQGGRAPTAPSNGRQVTRAVPAVPPPGPSTRLGRTATAPEVGPAALEDQAPVASSSLQPAPRNEAVSLFEEARQLDTSQASTLDLAKAAGLYRQAAQLGYAPALFLLGLAYDKGRGVGHDAMLAGLWYQRAAEHGSVKAMYNLAVLYAGGAVMGVPDYEQAARWFHQAAEQGHVASQYNFALLAAQGLGTRRDLVTSYQFLAQAAAKGDLDALAKLNEIEQRMTLDEKARAKG